MGTLTLDEMKTELRSSLGGRTDLNARLTTVINLAQMRIARKYRWEELEALFTNTTAFTSTPASDKFLALPLNVRDIYSVRLIDGANSQKLTRVPNRSWDKRIPEPEYHSTGRPSLYTLRRNIMEFWRVPDKAYDLVAFGIIWPTAFTDASPSAVSTLDQKDDMLITLSMSWIRMSLSEIDAAARWWTIYADMINDSVNEEVEKPDLDFPVGLKADDGALSGNYYQDPFVKSVDGI